MPGRKHWTKEKKHWRNERESSRTPGLLRFLDVDQPPPILSGRFLLISRALWAKCKSYKEEGFLGYKVTTQRFLPQNKLLRRFRRRRQSNSDTGQALFPKEFGEFVDCLTSSRAY